ncbi:MAG: hypothetical protein AAFR61_29630 [Bacteroidota bacterium]
MDKTHQSPAESPFLQISSFTQEAAAEKAPLVAAPQLREKSSPFQTIYELEGGVVEAADGEEEVFHLLMDELHDEEFDDAVEALVLESRELYENYLSQASVAGLENEALAFQLLEENYQPMEHELGHLMDQMIQYGNQYDEGSLSEEAYLSQVESLLHEREFESPAMEYFFKKLWKKAKSIGRKVVSGVKKGIKFVKKIGLGFVLRKLKGVVMKFLKRVLNKVIHKLPRPLRPFAQKLAQKVGGRARRRFRRRRELPEDELEEEAPFEVDFEREEEGLLQDELDFVVSEMLLAENEYEFEAAEQMTEDWLAEGEVDRSMQRLDEARQKFIRQISELEEGEDPEPIVEEFVTVALTVLRWGIRIIGKKRVKRFLVKIISSLIRRLVGRRFARPLAGKIVDMGFRLLRLELGGEEESELVFAGEAVAATIEDTLHELANLEEFEWEDEALLESQVVQAFEHSAAANLPDVLQEEQYMEYPDLRESFSQPTMWKWKNIGSKTKRKYRYKKLSKVFTVTLTPQKAKKLKSFGGKKLADFLRDKWGVHRGRSLKVKVHLFELLPGGKLGHISKYEPKLPGLGIPGKAGTGHFHPLTSQAAAILLGEPGLGCKKCANCYAKKGKKGRHRFYYIEIPGAQVRKHAKAGRKPRIRRTSEDRVKLDFVRKEAHLKLYLSEAEAQRLLELNRANQIGKAHRMTLKRVRTALEQILMGKGGDSLRILHGKGRWKRRAKSFLKKVAPAPKKMLHTLWVKAISQALILFFRQKKDQFAKAVADDEDGVSLIIKIKHPGALTHLRHLAEGKKAASTALKPIQAGDIRIDIKPGHFND